MKGRDVDDVLRATETALDQGSWSAGDKELDFGNLFDNALQHREDRRRRLFAPAFVQSVDNDDRRNTRGLEWLDDQFLRLAFERLVHDLEVGLEVVNKG